MFFLRLLDLRINLRLISYDYMAVRLPISIEKTQTLVP